MSDEPISITEQLNTLYRQVAVLRAEVKAWREVKAQTKMACDDQYEKWVAIRNAMDQTDAAKALGKS